MTTAPLSPARLARIRAAIDRLRIEADRARAPHRAEHADMLTDLLAEVRRLTDLCDDSAKSYCSALDRASERYDELVASDAKVREGLAEAGLELEQQDRDLKRLRAEVTHWREARRIAVEAGEVLVAQRDERDTRIAALETAISLARAYTPFSPEPCPLCDGRTCAMHLRMDEQSGMIERLAKESDQRGRRITALETGLREACDLLADNGTAREAKQRLRALADAATPPR